MRKLYWSNLWTIFGIVAFLFWPWDNSHAIRVKTKWADRVKEAQIVARGVVLSVQSYWNPEKTMIYTENRISIKEYLKGSGPEEITLLIPGGKVGEDVLTVSDVPRFREGEHVVLTLEDLERVVGGPDGVFRLASKPEDLPKAASGRDGLFLQWLKDFLEGKTETTFEELIQEGSQLVPYPKAAITEVTPSEVSAGTGETITIRGSGFGLAPGSPGPGIAFRYYQNDYYWDSSFVRSWSDSEVVMEVWEKEIDAYSYVPGSWPNTVGFVNPSGTISPTWPLIVKFGYGKAKWPSPVVSYKLNVSQGPPGASDAIKRAANSWSDADSPFRFEFGGEISSCDYGARNGINEICFGTLSDSQTIGQAYCWQRGSTLQECDILFNTRFAFSTQSPVPQDRMDLESIALHELGHWLSLTDLYGDLDDGKVMYGFASYGEMKRSLSDGDKEGIRWIYRNGGPPSGPPATPTPLFPAGYVSTAYPTFSWSSVEGATSYVLYVSDSAQQGRINEEVTASQANCSDGETTCSVTFHLPLRAGLATWMVKAKNALGESPWSAPLEFTIVGPDLAVGWDYGYQTCKYTSRGINCKVISGLHVSNLGNETSLPVSVDVYLWDGDYFYWMKTVKIPKITGGGVKYKKIKFSYLCEGCSALQELYLVAEVDSGGFVSELDEENNLDLWGPLQ